MKIKKLDHLSEIYSEYDVFLIDLWGVMHNGIRLNTSAMSAVKNLENKGKKIESELQALKGLKSSRVTI